MKILKYENLVFNKCDCALCGAELEYDYTDVKTIDISHNSSIKYVSCPVCGHRILVSDKVGNYFSNNTEKETI